MTPTYLVVAVEAFIVLTIYFHMLVVAHFTHVVKNFLCCIVTLRAQNKT